MAGSEDVSPTKLAQAVRRVKKKPPFAPGRVRFTYAHTDGRFSPWRRSTQDPGRKGPAMSSGENVINPSDEVVRGVLASMKRVAVVGISAKADRASHGIARFLLGQELDVVGVNPVLKEDVLGLEIFPTLADVHGTVDVVDVFRRSEAVPEIVDAAVAMGAGCVWLQEGVVHEEAAAKARAAGLTVVSDRCIYKDWLRLMNG